MEYRLGEFLDNRSIAGFIMLMATKNLHYKIFQMVHILCFFTKLVSLPTGYGKSLIFMMFPLLHDTSTYGIENKPTAQKTEDKGKVFRT